MASAAAMAGIVGGAAALKLLFGVPLPIGGTITAIVAFGLLAAQRRGFRPFEVVIAGLMGVIALGFGYTLLGSGMNPGAMAAGLVPVVSRIPAFMDLVEDGETGFLTDYRDPAAAAASIRQALELSDARLVEMRDAARRAASRYDWSRVVNQIVDIYEEVIAQSRAYCHR